MTSSTFKPWHLQFTAIVAFAIALFETFFRSASPVKGMTLAIAWVFIGQAATTAYRLFKAQEQRMKELEERLARIAPKQSDTRRP